MNRGQVISSTEFYLQFQTSVSPVAPILAAIPMCWKCILESPIDFDEEEDMAVIST